MLRTIAFYGALLAATAFSLEWLGHRYALHKVDTELYVVGVAVIFIAIGIWLGLRLLPRPAGEPFTLNEKALEALGISGREREVLAHMAAGHSNKEIARLLDISPNTVKTHVASILAKLEATRRTQAIQKARELQILP